MPERRDGDWDCSSCNEHNFAYRNTCFKCNQSNGGKTRDRGGSSNGAKTGDWMCFCGAHNFASRRQCFKCNAPWASNVATYEEPNGGGARNGARSAMKPGDWWCEGCNYHNFASRDNCFTCKVPKETAVLKKGDWICPKEDCKNHNFASRQVCKRCPAERPDKAGYQPPVGFGLKKGDWLCGVDSCQNHNFAFRDVCKKCQAKKPEGAGYQPPKGFGQRPGDWWCTKCDVNNFASRSACFKCSGAKAENMEKADASQLVSACA